MSTKSTRSPLQIERPEEVTFAVEGEPKGKARPRFTRAGGAYTPKETHAYEQLVKDAYRLASDGAYFGSGTNVRITFTAICSVPKSVKKEIAKQMLAGTILPAKKPDIDNVLKIIMDGLNKTAFDDDKQVVSVHGAREYGADPRVIVTIGLAK